MEALSLASLSMNLPRNTANLLTGFRIAAAFFYLAFGLGERWREGWWIFSIAAATDFIDGTVARLFRQKTALGAFLDPAADKLLMFFGFLTLTLAGRLPLWLFLLVLGRDLMIVLGILFFRLKKVRLVYRPTFLSKTTTLVQILLLIGTLTEASAFFSPELDSYANVWRGWGRVLVGGLTAVTTIQYFSIGLRILKGSHVAQVQAHPERLPSR